MGDDESCPGAIAHVPETSYKNIGSALEVNYPFSPVAFSLGGVISSSNFYQFMYTSSQKCTAPFTRICLLVASFLSCVGYVVCGLEGCFSAHTLSRKLGNWDS